MKKRCHEETHEIFVYILLLIFYDFIEEVSIHRLAMKHMSIWPKRKYLVKVDEKLDVRDKLAIKECRSYCILRLEIANESLLIQVIWAVIIEKFGEVSNMNTIFLRSFKKSLGALITTIICVNLDYESLAKVYLSSTSDLY